MYSTDLSQEPRPQNTWVCSRPITPCYIIDSPRGMETNELADLYSGMEIIKHTQSEEPGPQNT